MCNSKITFCLSSKFLHRYKRYLYHKVNKGFFWDGLKSDIQKFVAECLVFQQNKVETIKTPGLLQPLAIPSQRWEEVSMDFIMGLPKSEGKSVIMVVVDRLTKYAHFCALSHPFNASTVTIVFMDAVATALALKGCAYLVSLSTTTMIRLFPFDLGRLVIKSIETSSQR